MAALPDGLQVDHVAARPVCLQVARADLLLGGQQVDRADVLLAGLQDDHVAVQWVALPVLHLVFLPFSCNNLRNNTMN